MKLVNKKIIIFSALLLVLAVPFTVSAADYITTVLQKFLNIILWPILMGGVVIMFIYAGFMFVTAAGDPTKVATARKAALFAIVGLIVAFLSFSIVDIAKTLFPSSGTLAPSTSCAGPGQCVVGGGGILCSNGSQCP